MISKAEQATDSLINYFQRNHGDEIQFLVGLQSQEENLIACFDDYLEDLLGPLRSQLGSLADGIYELKDEM